MNEHVNMNQYIAPKSDQINADDLIGGPRTITITRVTGNEGNAEQPVNVFFDGDNNKPFRPCKSMRRVMVKVWGADASKYVGRSMTIFRDPRVKWGGMEVGGIRISHMTGLDKPETMALTETRSARKPYTIQPLKMEERPAQERQGRQTPEEWVAQHKEAIDDCAALEDLDLVEKNGKRALDRLTKEHPDLADEVMHAYQLRREALSVEGPTDKDRGEANNDTGAWDD